MCWEGERAIINKGFKFIAAVIIILTGIIYQADSGNYLMEERPAIQESETSEQQPEIKPDKSVYHLEQRQYDETVYDHERMERVLSYIENAPEDSDGYDIEYELEREWLKKTSIFGINNLDDATAIINNYLKEQGISETIPDHITYHNGYPFIKYYEDDKSGKAAFVATVIDRGHSSAYVYCGAAYIEDFKKEGSYDYGYNQEGKLLSEKFYNLSGEQEVAISYTYNINVPFPIITKYHSGREEEGPFGFSAYFNLGQRFWVYDSFLEFDNNGRWVKYNGDLYNDYHPDSGIESYNTPIYNEEGRLEKIIETLRGSRYQDNPDEWVEDGTIEFEYDDSGSLIEVNYGGFSGNHGSSGNFGTIYYDENGRAVHIDSFHSSGNYHHFYLYQNNENYPFAIFRIGGMPYSSDTFDGYDLVFGMDFDAWLFLDE